MANADDVLSGDSYFMAELKSIKRIVEIPDNQKYTALSMKFLKVPTQLNELPLQNQYYHFYMKNLTLELLQQHMILS